MSKTAPTRLAMKLTLLMLFVVMLSARAESNAQTVSISGRNITLKQLFSAIKKQTGYVVFGKEELIRAFKPVTIDARNMNFASLLSQILEPQGLTFEIKEKTKTILLIEKKKQEKNTTVQNFLIDNSRFPVSGRIVDQDGQPLEGASVRIRGKRSGVTSNADGRFSLEVERTDTLHISYTGFNQKIIAIAAFMPATDIRMQRSENPLDDIQVIAYGATSKRLNTGAVSTVKSEDIQRQPVGNIMVALSGQVPGLDIVPRTGTPGSAIRFNIRGFNSLNGQNDPLVIIDGVPFNSSPILVGGNILAMYGHASPFNSINPNDIESIEVLKDADATAIYGSRGANGVILITTKKSKNAKTGVDVNVYTGVGKLSRKIDLLSTRQYLDMRYKAFENDNIDWRAAGVQASDLKIWDTTRYTDWQETLAGGTARYTNASVTLTGGNQYTNFSLGGTYWKETTIYPGKFNDQKI